MINYRHRILEAINQLSKKTKENIGFAIVGIIAIVANCYAIVLTTFWEANYWILIENKIGELIATLIISLSPELLGITIGIFVIDVLNGKRQEQQLKEQLIRQVKSKHNDVAEPAWIELKHYGWFKEANLEGANLEGANLEGANLEGANLEGANLQRAKLQGANLQGAKLWYANLQRAELWGADLQGADLFDAELQGAELWGADLQGAKLWHADLQRADLQGANLQGANLQRTNLQEANLQEVNLKGANIQATITITQLFSATINSQTILPNEQKLKDLVKEIRSTQHQQRTQRNNRD